MYLKHDNELVRWDNIEVDATNDDVNDWLVDYEWVDSKYLVSGVEETNPKTFDKGVSKIRPGLGLNKDWESFNDSDCDDLNKDWEFFNDSHCDDLNSIPSADEDDFEAVLEREKKSCMFTKN